jgi:hypothetical protein
LGAQKDVGELRLGAAAYFTKSDSLFENDSGTLLQVVESVIGKRKTAGAVAATSISFN